MPTKKYNEERKRMNKLLKQMRNRTPKRSKVGQAKGLPTDRSMSIAYENLADRSMVTEQEMKTLRKKH